MRAACEEWGGEHVVAADDVQSERLLLHGQGCGEDALVALLQDQVGRLIKPPQRALHPTAARRAWRERLTAL